MLNEENQKALKIYAVENDTTVWALLNEIVEKFLNKKRKK